MAPTVWYRVRNVDEGRRYYRDVLELIGEMRLLDVFDPDGNRIQPAQEL